MASKPKPLPVFDKRKNSYRLYFCYNGKASYGQYIANQHIAYCIQAEVNKLIIQFKNGLIVLPSNISLADYIFQTASPKPDPAEVNHSTVLTLEDLIREYRKTLTPPLKHKNTCLTEQVHLRHLDAFVVQQKKNPVLLEEINIGFFNQYKQFRYSDNIRTDTVKKELSTFQCMFGMAVENAYIKYNIVRDVKRDKSQIPCNRFHTHEEIQSIIKRGNHSTKELKELMRYQYLTWQEIEEFIALAKDHWLYNILITFAYTGIRRGELIKLEWADVDLDKKYLFIKSCKQSQFKKETVRTIPIHDKLLPVLLSQKLKTGTQRYVFLSIMSQKVYGSSLNEALQRLVKGTKFQGLGFHVFRHSLASNLALQHEDQRVIDRILGHQTEAMRLRYQHLFPQQIESAIKKLHQV